MSDAGRLPDSPAVPALAALGGWSVFVALRLWQVGSGDIGAFVVAGRDWTDASAGLPLIDGPGYDGQFFHRLASDPFAIGERIAGTMLDTPARLNRIGYPALSWLVSRLGIPTDWALVVVNLFAVTLLGVLGGVIARRSGRHAIWGLMLPVYFGFAFSTARDLAEVVAAAALVGGLWAAHQGRYAVGSLALAIAVLTRETVIVAVFAIGLVELMTLVRRRRQVSGRDAVWIAPGAVVLVWQVAARDRWGVVPLLADDTGRVRVPGAGLVEQLPTAFGLERLGSGWLNAVHALEIVVLLGIVVLALTGLRRIDSGSPVVPALVGLCISAVVVDVPEGIWLDRNDLRMFADLYVVAVMVLLLGRSRLTLPAIGVACCTALAGLSFLAGA